MKKILLLTCSVCLVLNANAQISLVKDIFIPPPYSIPPSSVPMHLTVYQNKLYFGAKNASSVYDSLWACDTADNTTTVVATWPGGSPGIIWPEVFPYELMAVANNKLFFTASATNASSDLLYSFDGSTITIVDDSIDAPEYITEMDGKIYMSAATPAYGSELWMYDPTTGNRERVSDQCVRRNVNVTVGQFDNMTIIKLIV